MESCDWWKMWAGRTHCMSCHNTPLPSPRRDQIALFILALTANLVAARFVARPGYMDAYYYFGGALQLARGRGFIEPYVWNYLAVPPTGHPPSRTAPMGDPASGAYGRTGRAGVWPSHLHWMPLTSIVAAPSIALAERLWGASLPNDALFRAAQLPFIGLASLLPLLSYGMATLVSGLRRHALAAAALTLFSSFYFGFWSNTDAFALYGLTAGGALLSGALAARGGDRAGRWFLVAGLCAGLAHLTRADGILILISLLAWEIIRKAEPVAARSTREKAFHLIHDRRPAHGASGRRLAHGASDFLSPILPVLLGYLFIMLPWFTRNLLVVGAPLAPGGTRTAWLTEYNDLFAYPGAVLTPARYFAVGWRAIISGKWSALLANLGTLVGPQGTIVAFPLVMIGLWKLRRNLLYGPLLLYGALLFALMTFVVSFPGARGGYFHSGAALLPFFFPAALVGLDAVVDSAARRLRHWRPERARPVFTALLVAFAVGLTAVVFWMRFVGPDWRRPRLAQADAVYTEIGEWLEMECGETASCPKLPTAAVNNPPGFYYHAGYPSIVIPDGSAKDLLAAMSAFGARWVVLDANYPPGLEGLYTSPRSEPRLRLRSTFADAAGRPVYLFQTHASP